MSMKFCSEPIFSDLRFFNEPEISDSGPSWRTCGQDFYVLKKSIDPSQVWTREPRILRRALYSETDLTIGSMFLIFISMIYDSSLMLSNITKQMLYSKTEFNTWSIVNTMDNILGFSLKNIRDCRVHSNFCKRRNQL